MCWWTWLLPVLRPREAVLSPIIAPKNSLCSKKAPGWPHKKSRSSYPCPMFCRETMVSSILDDEIYIMGRPNFRFLVLLKVVVPHVLMFSNLCPTFDRYISKWSRVVYLIKNILAVTCPIRKKNKIFSNSTHDNLQCSNPFKPARVFLTFEASQLPTQNLFWIFPPQKQGWGIT